MLVLGIETTCDETACAIVRDGQEILSNVIASQTDLHAQYGGVFPELACRRHIDTIIPVLKEGMGQSKVGLIAVAKGPGLVGALLIGLNTAKALSLAWDCPFVGVNHVEAHLYAAMMGKEIDFPALGIVISGGHTFMARILELGVYEMIGKTADDAVGEAFDKVAVMLGLSYPGGPAVEMLARSGDPKRYTFKAGHVKERPWDFSFSGLKTNVLYTLRDTPIQEEDKPHVAAAFQEAALGNIVEKSLKAAEAFECKTILVGGGVSCNQRLRALFQEKSSLPVVFPAPGLSTDNAAMIAGLGYHVYQRQGGDRLDLEPLITNRVKFTSL
jgi:N6-L-threonylcarbamoyladenine synthase